MCASGATCVSGLCVSPSLADAGTGG
jgi:hypothetical protein